MVRKKMNQRKNKQTRKQLFFVILRNRASSPPPPPPPPPHGGVIPITHHNYRWEICLKRDTFGDIQERYITNWIIERSRETVIIVFKKAFLKYLTFLCLCKSFFHLFLCSLTFGLLCMTLFSLLLLYGNW